MELNILIAAPDASGGRKLKARLSRLAAYTDFDGVSFYLNEKEGVSENMDRELWALFHIAFVHLDRADAERTGELLYRHNPACRLIYYRSGPAALLPLLPTRPVWYWDAKDEQALKGLFFRQTDSLPDDPYFFYYSDRLRSLAVPYESIGCFFSQKRAVYLHTARRDLGPLPRTLDQIEAGLPKGKFLRVHQSFLVRRADVRSLDRGSRTLRLADGYEVPVSRALYGAATALFDQNDMLHV